RGRGLGSALLRWPSENWAVLPIELEVFADNTPALRLYEHLGFLERGRTCRYAFALEHPPIQALGLIADPAQVRRAQEDLAIRGFTRLDLVHENAPTTVAFPSPYAVKVQLRDSNVMVSLGHSLRESFPELKSVYSVDQC